MTTNSGAFAVLLQRPTGDWIDVGRLRQRENTNWFESLPSYWDTPFRPILGQLFEEKPHDWRFSARVSLPRWFSHLLPEGQLRQAASNAAGIDPRSELRLLGVLGSDDLPGAIRVLPVGEDGEISVPEVDDARDDDEVADPVLKFSLAGLQMKFSVVRSEKGLTIPVVGETGDLILKLPDPRPGYQGVPEAEFAAMRLARAAEMDVPEVYLLDARGVDRLGPWAEMAAGLSFAIERYDRLPHGQRIHAEEFAQILDVSANKPRVKYLKANFETIANIAAKLAGPVAVYEVIDRIVLNVLIGNGDAHLKNWSVVYPDGQNARLSPLYDVVPTVLFIPSDDLGLNLNGSKSFSAVTPASFRRLGDVTGIGAMRAEDRARSAVERIRDSWHVISESLSDAQIDVLSDRLAGLPLANSGT